MGRHEALIVVAECVGGIHEAVLTGACAVMDCLVNGRQAELSAAKSAFNPRAWDEHDGMKLSMCLMRRAIWSFRRSMKAKTIYYPLVPVTVKRLDE